MSGFLQAALPLGDRIARARRIGLTFGRVYLAIRATRFLEKRLRPDDMEKRWSELHRENAERIYETAVELHGMILKGCQFLGARADALPREYVEVLSRLQDRVPPRSPEVIRAAVEHELRAPIEKVFASFSERPVAAASLAQVHEARLHDGRRVAVKVQYPEIAALVRSDLANLRGLFRAVGWLEGDFDLMPLVDELGESVPRELDFLQEGHNAERIAKDLAHRDDVVIPEILWEHSTRRVLVMSFAPGIKIDDVDALEAAGVDRARVATTLVECFCEMMLRHGFFHADPHPGNLRVDPDTGKLVLLDFGLTKELPPGFREAVVEFAAALLKGDADAMGHALVALGFETRDGSEEALHRIAALMLHVGQEIRKNGKVDPEVVERLRDEVPDEIRRNPIVRVPHHLVLVGRALALLSGVTSALGARIDFVRTVAPIVMGVDLRK